jgi:hypothetical protein
MTFASEWEPGTRTLHLRGRHGAWSLRPWPDPAVLAAIGTGGTADPPLFLELADAPACSADAVGLVAAGRAVPADLRRCVAAFAPPAEQLRALRLLHEQPACRALVTHAPALGRALLATWQHTAARDTLAELLRARAGRAQSRALLGWLGLPDSSAMLRAVQKVRDPRAWTLHDLQRLGDWLRTEPKTVQHLPGLRRIHVEVWQAARRTGPEGLLGVAFYRALLDPAGAPTADSIESALRVMEAAGLHMPRLLRPVRSPLELGQRLFAALEVQRTLGPPAPVRPAGGPVPCPMAMPDWIRPLATAADLACEGDEMGHCVGATAYRADLEAGRGFGFAVHHAAGRATAWVLPTRRAGVVRLADLQGPEDTEPDDEVRLTVTGWVDRHNAWAQHVLHGGPLPTGAPVTVPEAARAFQREAAVELDEVVGALLSLSGVGEPEPLERGEPGIPDLEEVLSMDLAHLVADTVSLREELSGLVARWRGMEAPGPAAQDAILLDFARCAGLLVRTMAGDAAELLDRLDPDDGPEPL